MTVVVKTYVNVWIKWPYNKNFIINKYNSFFVKAFSNLNINTPVSNVIFLNGLSFGVVQNMYNPTCFRIFEQTNLVVWNQYLNLFL